MTYDILHSKEKNCRTLNVFRILSIPVLTVIVFLIAFITAIIGADGYESTIVFIIFIGTIVIIVSYAIINSIYKRKKRKLYDAIEQSILQAAGVSEWQFLTDCDYTIRLNSRQAVDHYDDLKFFKEDETRLSDAISLMKLKQEYKKSFQKFLKNNEYTTLKTYPLFVNKIENNLLNTDCYYVFAIYISPSGRSQNSAKLSITKKRLREFEEDKSLLMSKGEYNKYIKAQESEKLSKKQQDYYGRVNDVIDLANENKDSLVNKSDADELDKLVSLLFDRTVNSIKKIKTCDSEEWEIIEKYISDIDERVRKITDKNTRILEYYASDEFAKIKLTCDTLMNTQREFNEYIDEKVKSISELFGTNVIRNETTNEDEFNYIHTYKKSITPFTAEVSSTVFASAENNPLDYVVKHFYPNKGRYPEQIRKLQLLVEELETLKEAKTIIENYKKDIQQYLSDVPSFIMENDEDGFYARLGFATINENTLTVEYKFAYTSNSGRAQRYFTVPMTEETIISLIEMLESKLTMSAFTKEQRSLMTSKLRLQIKERDNYTCKHCGNSIHKEPNLLLEIDHIIPVSKGGCTREDNLQTLCWKCNRNKSNKLQQNEILSGIDDKDD
ncbi:MAG: HNH endonuclease [Saccharofermentans sp.]|nr:HNH endonuclease [Saccharofermentans sp.]